MIICKKNTLYLPGNNENKLMQFLQFMKTSIKDMSNYKIKSRIWIESGNNVFVGEGRIKLLKAIEEHGSLSQAAKSIGMSYKKAWTLIDAVNKSAKEMVVAKTVGGQKGGGAIVTPYGKKLIKAFDTINQNCWIFLDQQLKTLDVI